MTQKFEYKKIACWNFGSITVDIVVGVTGEVARYWFHKNILYVGFVYDWVLGHAVLCFPGMNSCRFYVPDLVSYGTITHRFDDMSEVTKAIAGFEKTKTK